MYQSLPHSQSVFSIETANLVEPLFNFALKIWSFSRRQIVVHKWYA